MTAHAFVIHYCIITHIKITIQCVYCNPQPYFDHNTDSLFFFIISLITLHNEDIDIAEVEINVLIIFVYSIYLSHGK